MARPLLIVHSNCLLFKFFVLTFQVSFKLSYPIIQMIMTCSTQRKFLLVLFVVKPHIYKMQRMLNDRYIGMLVHSLEVLNFASL